MKMFRRIFALTMVIAMVCLFSASAFAYPHEVGDVVPVGNDHYINYHAFIQQIGTEADMNFEIAPGLESYDLDITCEYTYKNHSNQVFQEVGFGVNNEYSTLGGTLFSISTSSDPLKYKQFTRAEYTFDAEFTASFETYTFNPGLIIVEP